MTDWTSYKDAAKAGYSNIATQGEWERRKKMGYSTYQDYLKAMHEKHASGSNNTTLTAPAPTTVPTTPETVSKGTTPSGGSNDFGAKYSGKDYLQWYKTNYGSDYVPESGSPNFAELDDVDGAIGQSLFNYYQNKQKAEKNHNGQVENINKGYDSTLDTIKNQYDSQTQLLFNMYGNANEVLDKSKSNSQQSASITLDKLKKYLPTQIKAQGLGGLGVSESTMLQSHNNYNNQMGQIEANYNNQKSAIDKNYNENKASYDNTYNNSTADIKSEKERALAELLNNYSEKTAEYDIGAGSDSARIFDAYKTNEENKKEQLRQEKVEQDRLDKENAWTSAVVTMDDLISNGNYGEAKKYLNENGMAIFGQVGINDYMSRINSAESKAMADKTKEEKSNTDTRILEGKEYVSSNGGSYKIKSQLDSDANEIKRNNDFKKQLKDKCGTTNPNDSEKIPNGTTFAVKADNKGSNDFNLWDDVGAALMSPLAGGAWDSWGNWNTVYMTYYNGNWYKSDKK